MLAIASTFQKVSIESGQAQRGGELCYDVWCDGVATSPIQLLGGIEYWGSRETRHMALSEAVWRTEALIKRTVAEYPTRVGPPTRLMTLLPSRYERSGT